MKLILYLAGQITARLICWCILTGKGKRFLQPGEIDMVSRRLKEHGYDKGIRGLIDYAVELGKKADDNITATTDWR